MIEPKILLDEIFRNFIYTEEEKPFLSQLYADYLAKYILNGNLPPGEYLPTVKFLHLENNVPYHVISDSFQILKDKGLLLVGRGIKTQVAPLLPETPMPRVTSRPIYADFHCMPYGPATESIKKRYYKIKFYHMVTVPPRVENAICHDLLKVLQTRFNKLHDKFYGIENFLYVHSYYHLIRAIAKSLSTEQGVIVIPKNTDVKVLKAFNYIGLEVIEVDTDAEGIDIKQLSKVCIVHHVVGVYLMSAANFSDCRPTSDARISEILNMQDIYRFKIIENNFYEPWQHNQKNKVLSLGTRVLRDIIYIYPLCYFIKDISLIYAIAADADTIRQIEYHLITDAVQWHYSLAKTTAYILSLKLYENTMNNVKAQMSYSLAIIKKVFADTGFWEPIALNQDAGLSIVVKPKVGWFPADTIQRFREPGIYVYLVEIYEGNLKNGVRIDLSHYIGSKTLEATVRIIESTGRGICLVGEISICDMALGSV